MRFFAKDRYTGETMEFGRFYWSRKLKEWGFMPEHDYGFGPANLRTIADKIDELNKDFPNGPIPSDDFYSLVS